MDAGYRQLPDGTWLNESTGVVSAPNEDAGPAAMAVSAPGATMLNGFTGPTRAFLIAGIIGIAAVTVWLQNRK